jgi:hypothetical protein
MVTIWQIIALVISVGVLVSIPKVLTWYSNKYHKQA